LRSRHDEREAVAARTLRLGPDRVLERAQAFLAHGTLAGFEPIAEELETLSRLPAVADTRLLGMQRKAVLAHPSRTASRAASASSRVRHRITKSSA